MISSFSNLVVEIGAGLGTYSFFGLAGWFDLQLTENHILSNAPSNLESTWGQVFFPFSTPLQAEAGEIVTLRVSCVRSARTRDLWWTWQASAASGLADNRSFQGIPLNIGDNVHQ